MSAFPGPANPLFYAQFYVRGGWKNTLAVTGGYALLIGGSIWLTAYNARGTSSALQGWLHGLLGLQVFILLLYGSNRVSAAVRGDITSKIMESHRLMPTSAFAAVAGYVVGGPIQAIALALVNLTLGVVATTGTNVPLQSWLVANLMLGAFVLMAWVITAQIAFAAKGGFVLMLISTLMGVFSNGAALVLLPGLSVITCPLIGRSVFQLSATFDDLSFPFAVALVAQFVVGAICFRAAMRKYRAPESVGFNTFLGLLLLAAWVTISLLGALRIEEFVPPFFINSGSGQRVGQFVSSVVASMLLAIIPVCSAARAAGDWRRNGGATPAQPRRPLPLVLPVLLATAAICLLLAAPPRTPSPDEQLTAVAQSVVVVLVALAALALLFRWVYLGQSKAWLVALIWLVLAWLMPMIADVVYRAMQSDPPESMTMISGLSPIGALALIWKPTSVPAPVLPGILFQCAMVMLPGMLYWTGSRRRHAEAAVPTAV